MKKRVDYFWRLYIIFIIITSIIAALFISYNYYTFKGFNTQILNENAIKKLKEREELFKEFIQNSKNSIIFLRNSEVFKNYLQKGEKSAVEKFFLNYAISNNNISRIRYINKDGFERIKIDRDFLEKEPYISNSYNNKLYREYFIDAKLKKSSDIFFSSLELRMENYKIKIPYEPNLRVIVPIEKEKKFDGILLINYNMENFLETFFNITLYKAILCDIDGFILKHYDKDKNWSKYNSKEYNIRNEFKKQAAKILNNDFFKSDELVSLKLNIPTKNQLFLILQLNESSLDSIEKLRIEKYIYMSIFILITLIIATFILAKIISRIFNNIEIEKEKIEYNCQLRNKFFTNMHHEIRTPVGGIIGLIEILLKTEINQTQKDYLIKIKNSGITLLNIINDILDYTKIDAGKIELQKEPFYIKDILLSVSDIFENTLNQNNINLHFDLDESINTEFQGDALRITQIFNNIVGNAVKFTTFGDIIIKISSEDLENGYVKLICEIIDTGKGINTKNIPHLFDAFYQENIINNKNIGTGLGLAITKKLINLMNGEIWVESQIGKGSKFYFYIIVYK